MATLWCSDLDQFPIVFSSLAKGTAKLRNDNLEGFYLVGNIGN